MTEMNAEEDRDPLSLREAFLRAPVFLLVSVFIFPPLFGFIGLVAVTAAVVTVHPEVVMDVYLGLVALLDVSTVEIIVRDLLRLVSALAFVGLVVLYAFVVAGFVFWYLDSTGRLDELMEMPSMKVDVDD